MAMADYFLKNAMAASQVLQHFENAGFESLLARQCVAVAIDGEAAKSNEGVAAADLAVRLVARFYPRVAILPIDLAAKGFADDLIKLAKEINPKIAISTSLAAASHAIVLGQTKVTLSKKGARTFYVGSRGWTAKLSLSKPVGSGKSSNPFGAGVAACFGVANVFRAVFTKQLPDDAKPSSDIKYSVIDYKAGKSAKPTTLKPFALGDACLVGAGAIGNGAMWALMQVPMKGSLTIVDPQNIELGNLQRYVLTTRQDEFHPKATLAERWFADKKDFTVVARQMTWDDFARRSQWNIDRVAVALDTAKDRIGVQASLPRWIVNAWTQGSAIGISRHPRLDGDACLACLYLPDMVTPSEDVLIANSLGLVAIPQHPDLMDVRRRLELGVPNDRAFLERVASIKKLPLEQLLPFESKTLRALYTEGVCGGQVMGLVVDGQETRAEVPLAFQSAMAGILLAAELVIDASGVRPEQMLTISRLDLLRDFPDYISSRRAKDSNNRCLCQDDDFRDVYTEKYGT